MIQPAFESFIAAYHAIWQMSTMHKHCTLYAAKLLQTASHLGRACLSRH